jgi:hypothetical protein
MLDGSFVGTVDSLEEARNVVYMFIGKLPADQRYKKYLIYDKFNNLTGSGSTN